MKSLFSYNLNEGLHVSLSDETYRRLLLVSNGSGEKAAMVAAGLVREHVAQFAFSHCAWCKAEIATGKNSGRRKTVMYCSEAHRGRARRAAKMAEQAAET